MLDLLRVFWFRTLWSICNIFCCSGLKNRLFFGAGFPVFDLASVKFFDSMLPFFWVLCFWFAPKSPEGFFVGSFLVAARRSAQSYWAKCSEHDFRIKNYCSSCLMFNLWYQKSSVPLIYDWCLDFLSVIGTFQCGIYFVRLSEAFVRTKSSYLKLHFGCERFGKRQGVFLRIRAFAWGTSLIS